MTITQQQQLALQRGLLYDIAANKLVTFDPVAANTNAIGLSNTDVITAAIPTDSQGNTETVQSVFNISNALYVNLTEAGKVDTVTSVFNRVQGVTGFPYIFLFEVLSATQAPLVGDTLESFPGSFDGLYEEDTTIEEINPAISFKIVDISVAGANATDVVFNIFIIPEQNFRLSFFGDPPARRIIRHKFTAVNTSSLLIAAELIDLDSANKTKLAKQLGYSQEEIDLGFSSGVSFVNLIKDIFGEALNNRKVILNTTATPEDGTPPSIPPWVNGVATVQGGLLTEENNPDDFANFPDPNLHKFEIFLKKSNMRVYNLGLNIPAAGGAGLEPNLIYYRDSGWSAQSSDRPGSILFDTFITGGLQRFTYVPSTGNFSNPINNDKDTSDNDLFLYKLNKPLLSFVSSAVANSKTNVISRVILASSIGLINKFGASINKNTLLDSWEAGYHKAGRILQNKLKK